jgi:hypothetical protein
VRTLSSFVPYEPSAKHELLYLAIDLLLLFGILGVYAVGSLPRWVCVETIVLGLANLAAPDVGALFTAAGIAFGLGFVGAGLRVWSQPRPETRASSPGSRSGERAPRSGGRRGAARTRAIPAGP